MVGFLQIIGRSVVSNTQMASNAGVNTAVFYHKYFTLFSFKSYVLFVYDINIHWFISLIVLGQNGTIVTAIICSKQNESTVIGELCFEYLIVKPHTIAQESDCSRRFYKVL